MSSIETERLRWESHGPSWPNRHLSRFVTAGDVRFHVQVAGDGPALLLLHGAGGSTHSWARILPRLAQSFRVVVPDLPGHAFSSALPPERTGPVELTTAVTRLLDAVAIEPTGIVAHSAGAAVAVCLVAALDAEGAVTPERCAFLAPSLTRPPRTGPPFLQELMAPLLRTGRAAELAALLARPFVVKGLLKSTGSDVPAESAAIYRRLTGNPAHVGAVLRLLTRWDPESIEALLPGFSVPTLVLAGAEDGWIPHSQIEEIVQEMPDAELRVLDGLGHLLHEEDPERVLAELSGWFPVGSF